MDLPPIPTDHGPATVRAPTFGELLEFGDQIYHAFAELDQRSERSWALLLREHLLPLIEACTTVSDGTQVVDLPAGDAAAVLQRWFEALLHPNVVGLVRTLLAKLGIQTGLIDRILAGTGPADGPGTPSPISSALAGQLTPSAQPASRKWWQFWRRTTAGPPASASS